MSSSYAEKIQEYLGKVAEIAKSKPAYKQPGDGSDGTCDCIGLLIGAIRKMGLKWSGIHGSNYAARKQVNGLAKIGSIDELELGDAVFKAYEKGEKGWDLPGRYWQGKAYYNGDLRDYYHVGTVTKKSPGTVEITHMSGPGILTLTAKSLKGLGKWAYHGKLKPIVAASDGGVTPAPAPAPAPSPDPAPIPSAGSRAVVVAETGDTVFMRQYPDRKCRTWVRVPVGDEVEIVSPGETWAKINGGGRKGWYMMAKFLDVIGDGKGKY